MKGIMKMTQQKNMIQKSINTFSVKKSLGKLRKHVDITPQLPSHLILFRLKDL